MIKLNEQPETKQFLDYLSEWYENLPAENLEQLLQQPEKAAILSVDVLKGFCSVGPLSSPRVGKIVQPIVRLMSQAWGLGLRHIILNQDTHEPDAVEFNSWPPHCVRGTEEAETVSEIRALPFFKKMVIFEKNSIASGMSPELNQWLLEHPEVETFIVVGDCTDLCTYQLAMWLRLEADSNQKQRLVIVPENCVQTYHLSTQEALQIGIMPHPGDFTHLVFLNHMVLNGIKVVASLE
ncbi:MAG: nicotinamidase [Anaerolineaceae bacterium]|nr:nicotinamidase [Anaerolineaceae bacterium]